MRLMRPGRSIGLRRPIRRGFVARRRVALTVRGSVTIHDDNHTRTCQYWNRKIDFGHITTENLFYCL